MPDILLFYLVNFMSCSLAWTSANHIYTCLTHIFSIPFMLAYVKWFELIQTRVELVVLAWSTASFIDGKFFS